VGQHRRDRRFEREHEPAWDDLEFELCGDEPILVIDRTESGAPYGPRRAEMRRISERDARGAGWARAKYVLRELISREVGPIRELGWVTKIGDGLSREIFAAEVEFVGGGCESYVVALPRPDAPPALNDSTTVSFDCSRGFAPTDFRFIFQRRLARSRMESTWRWYASSRLALNWI